MEHKTLEEFLTTKFVLWTDTRWCTDNNIHGSCRTVEKSEILLHFQKSAENSDGDLTCHMLSLQDAVAHLLVSNPTRNLIIEK